MSATNGAARTSSSVGTHTLERFPPGAIVSVGTHRVEVVNYLAEGGFAQIYVVKFLEYLNEFESKLGVPLKIGDVACLKRVLVQDENGLGEMRNEVEVMKQLMGSKNIVQYYDSNACRRHHGAAGFEVLLLMELCPNKSLLDYMNQRLATKLTEKEVLKIMYDVSLAVSQMHYLKVPLIHRDIKIENVLVDAQNNFKLCDFGSTSQCFPVVTTHQEIAILTQNIYVHTTPQYRCPEMIDLYRCLPINEKSDIWALGIFLYKLLFFITPFELTGQFAILHSKYEFPPNNFSSQLINLVIIMLAENPYVRPNIYQILCHICSMIGVEVPIEDKYGLGPYNFEKYTQFQTKLQNVQYQMYLLQQKKLENKGPLNGSEENMLNDLIITTFEVSGKIPIELDSRASSKSPKTDDIKLQQAASSSSENILEQKHSYPSGDVTSGHSSNSRPTIIEKPQHEAIENTQEIESERKDSNEGLTAEKITAKKDGRESSIETGMETALETSPGLASTTQPDNELNLKAVSLDQKQKSLSSFSSGGKSYLSVSHGLSSEEALITESTAKSEIIPGAKQHKINNPFPRMAQGFTDSVSTGNFFLDENSRVQNNQQQAIFPQDEIQYGVRTDQAPFQQRSQFPAQPSQQLRQQQPQKAQQNMFIYRPADVSLGFKQQQSIPSNQPPDLNGFLGPNARYTYQGAPPNGSGPYYPIQQPVQQHSQANQQMQQREQGQHLQRAIKNQTQPQAKALADSIPHQLPTSLSSMVQEDAPPPMPARHEKHAAVSSEPLSGDQRKEQEPLIEFSPPKEQLYARQNEVTAGENSPTLQKTSSRHGNLDLSYNEMDLSQEDITKDSAMHDALHTGGMDSSMASSESIELNLEDARRGNRSLRVDRMAMPTRRFDSPSQRKGDTSDEKKVVEEQESILGEMNPSRRSLDLKYHEVHFSSPDLNNENESKHLNRHKTSGPSKHKTTHTTKHKSSDTNELGAHSGRRVHSTSSSNSTSRKYSSNSGNSAKGTAQIKNDLERYKTSNKSGSNSSVNISSTSVSGMRRSFAKARQSLDLERVRREALNNSDSSVNASGGKRRSLFSVFRGASDKK